MFKGEYEHRSHRQNTALAGGLALVAGMVNTLGFLKEGIFTSHVTGHAGQLSLAITLHSDGTLWTISGRILAFFFGALLACLAIEGSPWQNKAYIYSVLLILEASLLSRGATAPAGVQFGEKALFAAMGLQNGLVTRLSGAVVRTTHLTGVVTDLGIEVARWGLLFVARATSKRETFTVPFKGYSHPSIPKSLLLLTICTTFLIGGVIEVWLFSRSDVVALVAPIVSPRPLAS